MNMFFWRLSHFSERSSIDKPHKSAARPVRPPAQKAVKSCSSIVQRNAMYLTIQQPSISKTTQTDDKIGKTTSEFVYIYSNPEQKDQYNRYINNFFFFRKTYKLEEQKAGISIVTLVLPPIMHISSLLMAKFCLSKGFTQAFPGKELNL